MMVFIQTLAMSAVPAGVVIIASPTQTLPGIALVISLIFCLVIVIVYFVQPIRAKNTPENSLVKLKKYTHILIQTTSTLMFSGVVFAISVLYLILADYGVTSNGISGFTLSLIPSVLLSMIGYYIKLKFLKREKTTNEWALSPWGKQSNRIKADNRQQDPERAVLENEDSSDCDEQSGLLVNELQL